MSSRNLKEAMESINVTLGAIEGVLENGDSISDAERKTVAMLKRINSELEAQLEGIQGSKLKVVEPSKDES